MEIFDVLTIRIKPWHKQKIDSKFTIWAAEPSPVDSDDDIAVEPPKGIIKHENKWAEVKINH